MSASASGKSRWRGHSRTTRFRAPAATSGWPGAPRRRPARSPGAGPRRPGDVPEPRGLLGVSDQRHHPVGLVEQHAHGVGIELARDQHGGVLAGQLVGGGQRAGEATASGRHGDRLGAGHARGSDQARDHAFQGRSGDQADLLAAGRARAHARAEQRRAPRARSEQALALGLDYVDQDARKAARQLEQIAGVELERVGDRARRHGRGALGAGDRVLGADHVALAHPQLDLAAAGGGAGGPDDQPAGDQPDAVARVARGAQLLAGRELARAHARGDDLELARRLSPSNSRLPPSEASRAIWLGPALDVIRAGA